VNLKKQIRTSTLNMTAEDWLAFRQPLTHVKKFIMEKNKGLDNNNWLSTPNEMYYNGLVEFFKSDDWKNFNFPCFGASEMGIVVGESKYTSSVDLFYEKVGVRQRTREENQKMFWGKQHEPTIADKWQYWPAENGSAELMIENFNNGKIERRCRNINFYVQNTDAPWIFASLDRIINKTVKKPEGALECKTISGWYSKQWLSGTPFEHIVQIMTQMGVTGLMYGELALLIDGNEMEVLPFDHNEDIWSNIKIKSLIFYQKIKKAIAYYILLQVCNPVMRPSLQAGIDALAPDPDGSVSYENYLKERYSLDNGMQCTGGEIELLFAKRHEMIKQKIKILMDQRRLCSNFLKNMMKENQTMGFGDLDSGSVTWRKIKSGSRPFKVNLKVPEIEYATLEELTRPDQLQLPGKINPEV
jgi:putative phage-type endonuclease